MPMRFVRTTVLLGTALMAQAAAAGELTLYGRDNFEGRKLAVRAPLANLERAGFQSRVGSMLVSSGRWELCTEAGFRGDCFIAEPGEYKSLSRFINTISSVRELAPRVRSNPRREPSVELFEGEGFDGARVIVREPLATLRGTGFDDRAGSLIVYGGRWEFCQFKEFGGRCLTYGPGRYEHLGALHRQISSIRRVR